MTSRIFVLMSFFVFPATLVAQQRPEKFVAAQPAGREQSQRQHLSSVDAKADTALKMKGAMPNGPFEAPTSHVTAFAVSPNGHWIATGHGDAGFNRVILWDRKTGAAKWVLTGHHRHPTRLEFSPDGSRLLASHDVDPRHRDQNELSIWNTADGKLIRCHEAVDWSLSKAGDVLAVARWNYGPAGKEGIGVKSVTIEVVDFAGQTIRRSIERGDKLFLSVALSPDAKTLAVGCRNEILFFNVATGEALPSIAVAKERVHTLAFSPDGRSLASVSDDLVVDPKDVVGSGSQVKREIQLWNFESKKSIATLRSEPYSLHYYDRLRFANPRILLARQYLGPHEVWDIETQKTIRSVKAGVLALVEDGAKCIHNEDDRNAHAPSFRLDDLSR